MNTALATTTHSGNALAKFEPQQLDILRKVLCPTLNNDELAFFASVCERQDLDPFAKEIYVEKRVVRSYDGTPDTHKLVFITGIDGYRKRAESTGEYEGPISPQWCGKDGVWKDVWLEETPPVACRVGVKRRGWSEPVYAIARYSAYVQLKGIWENRKLVGEEPNAMWKKMAPEQMAKCAEVLAIKKAFPKQTGATTGEDELGAVDGEVLDAKGETVVEAPALAKQRAKDAAAPAPAQAPAAAPPPKPKEEKPKPAPVQAPAAPPPAAAAPQAPVAAASPMPAPRSGPDAAARETHPVDPIAVAGLAKTLTTEMLNAAVDSVTDKPGLVASKKLLERARTESVGTPAERNDTAQRWMNKKREIVPA